MDAQTQVQVEGSKVRKVDSNDAWIAVHFSASWCAPSIAMNSLFEELAVKYDDILFLLVDVDEVKGVAAKMEVKAMPTFMFLKDGMQVDKLVGANPDEIRKRVGQFARSMRVK
ncbi:thioredoxin-like protein CXXS1 isoform X2 [Amborella trichopoda]|uniref:thioredoxin-like protein CXXS1 isoform X2 n=1 Tax=Amborella trichopoda TaxID=13333 RepID=UPI0009C06F18|nr:thioredoxin-like protein CXXS1 isoform X2 [Amborella trichopoda]|eukprot:XP_020526655.1 thioredoxin-like protein CXXS1 isoform X2 [Amborella trichopoda]